MLPDASLLMLKGGLALGTSSAALGLAAHSALVTAGLALLPLSPSPRLPPSAWAGRQRARRRARLVDPQPARP